MSLENANPTADQTSTTAPEATRAQTIALGAVKLAGLALLAYRAYAAAKQPKLASAAEPQVTRSSDGQSMAKVDPNFLLRMASQHMSNMTRPRMW